MEQEFRLAPSEEQLLNELVSRPLIQVRYVSPSYQSALYEPGTFCQAVVLKTNVSEVVIKSACEDLGDIEVFWLSVISATDQDFLKEYAQMRTVQVAESALGTVTQWRKIEFSIDFERKSEAPLKAATDFGLLLQFEDCKRLLVTTAPLHFFVRCFTDSAEIDMALAAIAKN